MRSGAVNPDGSSSLISGLVDSSAGSDSITLDAELQKRLDSVLNEELEVRAAYKLEVVFLENRSRNRPYAGIVTAWSNGGYANGGGDEAVYFCPSIVEIDGKTRTCSAALDLKWINKNVAVCPKCRNAIDSKELGGQIFAKLPTAKWSELLTRMWANLGGDADIRMGVLRGDLRQATVEETSRPSRGSRLNSIRMKREWVVYPLRNIIKDTSTGSTILSRIQALLSA